MNGHATGKTRRRRKAVWKPGQVRRDPRAHQGVKVVRALQDLVDRCGEVRDRDPALLFDSQDWQQYHPEQAYIGVANFGGSPVLKVGKVTRQMLYVPVFTHYMDDALETAGYTRKNPPEYAAREEILEKALVAWREVYSKWYHRPHRFLQACPMLLYPLAHDCYCDAFLDLLHHGTAVARALVNHFTTQNLPGYIRKLREGQRAEISRREVTGLRLLHDDGTFVTPPPGSRGYEVIEVECRHRYLPQPSPEGRRLNQALYSGILTPDQHQAAWEKLAEVREADQRRARLNAQENHHYRYYVVVRRCIEMPTGGQQCYGPDDDFDQLGPHELVEVPGHWGNDAGEWIMPADGFLNLQDKWQNGWWRDTYVYCCSTPLEYAANPKNSPVYAPLPRYAAKVLHPVEVDAMMESTVPEPYLLVKPQCLQRQFTRLSDPRATTKRPTSLSEFHPEYLDRLGALATGAVQWDPRWPGGIEQARRDIRRVNRIIKAGVAAWVFRCFALSTLMTACTIVVARLRHVVQWIITMITKPRPTAAQAWRQRGPPEDLLGVYGPERLVADHFAA